METMITTTDRMPEVVECAWCGRMLFSHDARIAQTGNLYERVCPLCYSEEPFEDELEEMRRRGW